ncbi:M20/M25/M40 family metallo-hydrolase [Cryomorphaceae bacterium]|nr:M20/M25/M40 family metallo-hydrolase [Cryomorphaceae bacterium]
MKQYLVIGLTAGCLLSATAQDCNKVNKKVLANFEGRVEYLASDALEGREAGTDGEAAARDYIVSEMEAIGLEPKGSEGYLQAFSFKRPMSIDNVSTYMKWKGPYFRLGEDFYPTKYSSNGTFNGDAVVVGYGIEAPELGYTDYRDTITAYQNKVFFLDIGSPDGTHPHSKFRAYHDVQKRLELAVEKGAKAIILFNTDENAEDPESSFKTAVPVGVPVVFWTSYDNDDIRKKGVRVSVKMDPVEDTGYNVIGYLDRGSDKTIVIGAHYDHLGFGGEGSRYTGTEPMIHNGADDNASGTAGILELASYYSKKGKKMTGNNILFIAFSAEEKGLLGSKYFVENPTIGLNAVNYMINFDMIGSLDVKDGFIINGVGTSPSWNDALAAVACDLKYTTTESGIGPSDHTSFYLKDIPSLHFFTGATEFYHKPTDDPGTLNMAGAVKIVEFTKALINGLNDQPALAFSETTQQESMRVPKFKVTLGVMPDYAFEGPGMKIDGIIPDRPAQAAGLQEGDVVLQIGDMSVADMQGYMKALSAFEKGDEVTVTFLRNGKEGTAQLTF